MDHPKGKKGLNEEEERVRSLYVIVPTRSDFLDRLLEVASFSARRSLVETPLI